MGLGVLTSQILTLAKSHIHLKGGPSPSPRGLPLVAGHVPGHMHALPGGVAPSWACPSLPSLQLSPVTCRGKLWARPLWASAPLISCQLTLLPGAAEP